MKVVELLEALEGMPQDAEVRLAHQPNYPLEYRINDVADATVDGETIVYIAEGGQVGYLPTEAVEALAWN